MTSPPTVRWDGDAVVVGGGIAGAAMATALARAGHRVLVLEREPAYRDRVRGEIFVSWGVAELRHLGLEQVLLAAPGACFTTHGVLFDEIAGREAAPADAASLVDILPGIPGHLAVGHAEACTALARAACDAGATVLAGTGDVRVLPAVAGASGPEVRFTAGGRPWLARCRLVVGADGRGSAVRRQAGIALSIETSGVTGGGLLVRDPPGWPLHELAIGTAGDVHFQVFPRGDGHVRLYLYHERAQGRRFAGPRAAERFLQAFDVPAIPRDRRIWEAVPAGPCRSYAMSHSWTPRPYTDGVVLVGDAAGWSDPIIGQGLSVAVRDVRLVVDALLDTDDWCSGTRLAGYAAERGERMRRLRMSARMRTAIHCTFTRQGVERRDRWYRTWHSEPVLGGLELAVLVGPERAPDGAFTHESLSRVLALAG